jgi:Condensation domain
MNRQLGIEEHTLWLYDQAAPCHFAVTAKIVGELSIEQLQQTLVWVQQRHPLLRGKIALDQSGYPWFVEDLANIPLRVVKRQSEEQWQQEVEQEIAHPFDWNQAPLIRMVLVHATDVSELIITCHHALADGISTVYLLRDILQAMGLPDLQKNVLPERRPYEQLTPAFTQKLQTSVQETPVELPSLWVETPTSTQSTLPENCRPRLLSWSLSPEATSTVILRCQQEQTSVHAAICAAFLLAIYQQSDIDVQSSELKCLIPINIRQFLAPLVQEDFGYYFTQMIMTHTVTPNLSLWDLAHAIKSQLKQKMSPDWIFTHLPEAQDFIATLPSADLVKKVIQLNGYDVLVSNLGRLNIPRQYGHLQLAAFYGPSATSHFENDRFVGVATLGDQMFFSLVYSESDISPTQIERLQQEAMQLLVSSIQTHQSFNSQSSDLPILVYS